MTEDTDQAKDEAGRPEAVPIKDRDGWTRRLSFIWIIPLIAVLAALGVAWQNWSDRGPVIEVAFDQAAGVRPRQTELRYRDIPVGMVEKVSFSPNLGKVIVSIRLDKDVAPFVDGKAKFWIVRPKLTTQGVTGLDTVISGVYIAGSWDDKPGTETYSFQGQADAPLLALGESGVTFRLRSDVSLPPEGTPILFKGVTVGRLGPSDISKDGSAAVTTAVVLKPYDRLVTSTTRFWDTSGFSLNLNASGASVDFSTIASLISGGITFGTLAPGGTPIKPGMEFTFYPDEETARQDFLVENDGSGVDLTMIFEQNLSGLQTGAQVSLGGLKLGEVISLTGLVDEKRFGDGKVRLMATVRLHPGRLGNEAGADEKTFLGYLETRVSQGLRARLTNASLLTGGLMIELVDLPDAPPASMDLAAKPYPEFPTATANVTSVTATAQGLLSRIDALPVEELMQEVIGTLAAVRKVASSEGVQKAPDALIATLKSVQKIAESDAVAGLPGQISALTSKLTEASAQLTALLADVKDQAVVAKVSGLIAKLDQTAAALPGIAGQASAVLSEAQKVSLGELSDRIATLLDSVNKVVDQDSTRQLPKDFGATLSELTKILAEMRDGGVIANANATMASARDAAASISEAASTLPQLAEKLNSVATNANAMLAGYDANSSFGRELTDAMRQIQATAAAIERLARQLQRNPNSLLTGK